MAFAALLFALMGCRDAARQNDPTLSAGPTGVPGPPATLSAGPTAVPGPPASLPPNGPRLVVLNQNWSALQLGYEAAPALLRLQSVPLTDALFTAEPEDIDSYRVASESLVLTATATSRLVAALAEGQNRGEGVESLAKLKKHLGEGNALDRALYDRPFVVLLGDERLYGGIFLDAPSQMAIKFPVARVEVEHGQAVLHLLPVHLPFLETDPGAEAAPPSPPREVPSGMMDHFRAQAMSPQAVENRKLLREERLRAWLRAAGKLQ